LNVPNFHVASFYCHIWFTFERRQLFARNGWVLV